MNLTNITELCDIQIGRTPKRSEVKYWGNGHSWISIADMGEKYVYDSKEEVTNLAVEECRMKIVPKNTVVMSFKLTIGRLGITEKDLYTNEAIAAFLIKDKNLLLPEYLYYSLKGYNFDHLIDRAAKGKTLNKRKLSEIYIPLIPIDNQKKIIEILNKAENLLVKRQQQIEALSALKQSVFLDMFGDPNDNPHNWETRTLPNLVIDDKHSLKRGPFGGSLKKEIFVDSGYLVYEQYHAINDDYDFGRYFIDEKKYEEMSAFKIESGDLLISCSGTIGRISEVPPGAKEGIINQALLKLTLDNETVLNEYFIQLFLTNSMQNNLFGLSKGSGIKNFPSMKVMKQIKFIIPSLELQQKYVEKIHAIEGRLETLNKSYNEMKLLYNSLLHKAFNGELFKEEIKA